MLSTGQVAKATSDATVTLLLDNSGQAIQSITVVNESAGKGFVGVGFDSANLVWFYLPAGNPTGSPATPSSRTIRMPSPDKYKLYMQRSGGTDLSGVYADMC